MPKLTVELAPIRKPEWSTTPLKPGEEITLKTEAPKIQAGQFIEFRILSGADLVDVVRGQDAQQTAKWTVPNLPHSPKLTFEARLREKPSARTGIHAVLAKVTSPEADLKGFSVAITNLDAAFVPHTEKLQVLYTISDPAGAATKGRIEIWGERYPTDKPLYTENFVPSAGAKTWTTWDGKANAGTLSGKYLSPEFSPYRVRIVIGSDQAAVDDAFGAGLKKTTADERAFEVEFQSVHIRLQVGITEGAAGTPHSLAQALAVEPYNANGTYAAMGRLPLDQETGPVRPGVGRIRIPMACHHRDPADTLGQGGLTIPSAYMSGAGSIKQAVDALFYSRPEIPIEFEMRLKSRVPANNAAPKLGLFDKEAVGPVKIEPFADDLFLPALYSGAGVNQTFWRKSVCKVKHGVHTAPVNAANAPIFHHWQARFVVAADGDQNFDLDTFDAADTTYHYAVGSNELKVYLNRALLTRGADEPTINKGHADYIEVDNHTIKLRPRLTKASDVVWIVRSAAAGAVANWNAYPPGVNCHAFYGGVRGSSANALFKKVYAAAPAAPREPVIGRTNDGSYAYTAHDFINFGPDPVAMPNQERTEVSAILTGAQQGLAGIIFTPSFIAGDTYVLHARVNRTPYERELGWEDEKPFLDGKTGQMSIWRVITISSSQRLQDLGTGGLAAAVGSTPEVPVGARAHLGDGVNMSLSGMNTILATAFNEWTTAPPSAAAPAADVHKNVNLATYRTAYNGLAMGAGLVNLPNNAAIKNVLVPFDHYRVFLPGDVPANRVNAASNRIAALAAGSRSATAGAAVNTVLAGMAAAAPDQALGGGVAAIPRHPSSGQAYSDWVLGQIRVHRRTIMNALIPGVAQPKTMQVLRWPDLHDSPIWSNAAPLATQGLTIIGFEIGNGQSFFRTSGADPSLFAHEMGHGSHLIHFVAGNFGWKHHNVLQPDCMMSYDFPTGFIVQPGAAVGPTGGAAAPDTGWPGTVPAVLPNPSQVAPGTAAGTPCIQLDAIPPNPVPGNPCAKCMLKLRGWREDRLPAAWNHPDLF